MERRSRIRTCVATLALAVTLALGVTPAAFGDDSSTPAQPSAIERLMRQERARQAELARYDATARHTEWSAMLEARERAMVVRSDPADLDPAIRTAIAARTAEASAPPTVGVSRPAAGHEFAWGAAALGLGAGIAAMCVLLGCVTLVRSHGRLRSV